MIKKQIELKITELEERLNRQQQKQEQLDKLQMMFINQNHHISKLLGNIADLDSKTSSLSSKVNKLNSKFNKLCDILGKDLKV